MTTTTITKKKRKEQTEKEKAAAAAKASIWEVEINRKTLVRDGYRAFMTSSGRKSEDLSDLLHKRLKIKFFEEKRSIRSC